MTEQHPRLAALSEAGVSIWLDDLDRQRLDSNNLRDLVESWHIVGVTTNPTIFAKALSNGSAYDEQIRELAARGASVADAVREATVTDVRRACDVLSGTWEQSGGVDGRVSLEVDPGLAHETEATAAQALDLWKAVDRPNLMVKIPATVEGLPAITSAIAEGISVNVTLIFSIERYLAVMDAYVAGLEQAAANGHNLASIHSVASFFVSRVDTEIDPRLEKIGTDEAKALRGKAAIANARLAYERYEKVIASDRWKALAAAGAHVQRPLWASTGVKDPSYDDTMYVVELVAPDTVNTMPEATLDAVGDHGVVRGDTIKGTYTEAKSVLDALGKLGIDYDDVIELLETEGVQKFDDSYAQLADSVQAQLDAAGN